MSKSLTEVAKAVLMKENTALAATLKPNGGAWEGAESDPKHNEATAIADAPKKPGEGENVGAKAAVKGEDKSAPKKGATAAEAPKHLEEDEDVDGEAINEEEDVEISEELAAFIDGMIAEGASEDEIAQAIEENFEIVEEKSEKDDEDEKEDEDEDEKEDEDEDEDEGKKKIAEALDVDMSEDMEALFSGEELSEDFKVKAQTIFEAAVKRKLEEELAVLEEAFAATLQEEIENIQEELSSNVDDYLNYVVEQWTAENEVAIEAGLRTELTEDFISGLRNLFAEHYIDIPNDKISVVEEMAGKVEALEAKLNEEIERNVSLSKMLSEAKVESVLENACDGLTDTQAEKLKTLAEGIEYSSVEEYAQKVSTLKESYFNKPVKNENVLDSVEVSDGKSMISEESLSGPMAAYVKTLGKQLPK